VPDRESRTSPLANPTPVPHDLEQILRVYIEAAEFADGLFSRTVLRWMGKLTTEATSGIDI
jgi:hypothetical protein